MKKAGFIASYILAAGLMLGFRTPLIRWMESNTLGYQDAFIVLIGLIVAIVPAIPYGIVAAAFGAKYGPLAGSLLNVAISVSASLILFWLIRHVFTEEGRSRAAKVNGIRQLAAFAERNAFMAILFARLLPIVPTQAVNIFAAITRISWIPYLLATVTGKIPFLVMVTLLGDQFIQDTNLKVILTIAGGYVLFLVVVYGVYQHVRK
ncbi:TVP38/TMEM64 family protein [Cohnella massiliensis]|uniref:TVP38/TMEM64 family protein n=1 Tax=Cohnella massiliensis TaxID=1816691 RepID=UPI0009B94169|nr:VTT domain-containing protein [Cohnella massiliensis]